MRLAKAAHAGHTGEVLADLGRGLRMPARCSCRSAWPGVVRALAVFVFFHGQSRADTLAVAHLLTAMLLGLLPFGWVYLVQRVFYAPRDARTPFNIQVVITIIATIFNLIGAVRPATQTGCGWASARPSAMRSAPVGVLAVAPPRRQLGLTRAMRTNIRLGLASIAAGGLTYAVLRVVPESLTTNRLGALLVLACSARSISRWPGRLLTGCGCARSTIWWRRSPGGSRAAEPRTAIGPGCRVNARPCRCRTVSFPQVEKEPM